MFCLIKTFCSPKVEFSPDKISPMPMEYMFDDLISSFNEKTKASAGRHYTPREIIELGTHLDNDELGEEMDMVAENGEEMAIK